MKKLILFSALFAFAAVANDAVYAQEGTDPTKETVIIDPFTMTESTYSVVRDNIRSAVITGLANVGRFDIVDVLADDRVSQLFANRKAEDVVNDQNWATESQAQYKALGANKLIKGQIELLREYTTRNDEGKTVYNSEVNFTLQVFNLNDGSVAGSESYKYDDLSLSSYTDAFNSIARKASKDMTKFCNKFFKIESYILELGETDKKGTLASVWISGGKNVGFSNGTIFLVKAEQNVGSKPQLITIGQIKAQSVEDEVTLCVVTDKKTGIAIMDAFNNGKKMQVISDRKRGDGTTTILRGLGF